MFLSYASEHAQSLLDRECYLFKAGSNDRDRCRQAGIPDDRSLATKPALARRMLARTFDADVGLAWVTGDSVYGDNRKLRSWLEERKPAYVLAVSGNESVWLGKEGRVATLLTALEEAWERISAGVGTKGPRGYEWQRLTATPQREVGSAGCSSGAVSAIRVT